MASIKSTFNKPFHFGTYLLCTWLFSVFLCTGFFQNISLNQAQDYIHSVLALATYGLLYQAPAILIYIALNKCKRFRVVVTIITSALCHLLIFSDVHLFDLYGFHFNGFVWNLLTTPGGYESLGADQTNFAVVIRYLSILIIAHLTSVLLALYQPFTFPQWKTVIVVLLLSTLSERIMYGISDAQLYGPTLSRGDALWLYQPLTMRSLLQKLGIDVKKTNHIKLANHADASVDYPKKPLQLQKVDKPMNIIWG